MSSPEQPGTRELWGVSKNFYFEKNPTANNFYFNFLFFFFFVFLGAHLWHMEVPRLGVESELELPAYTTVTATQDPSPHLRPTPQLTATPDP